SLKSIVSSQSLIREERELFRKWVATLDDRVLTWGTIHGDFYPNNLLVEAFEITGVVDWDDCQREWLVWELSRALWEFCKNEDDHTLKSGWATSFIHEYCEAGDLVKPHELELIIPLI